MNKSNRVAINKRVNILIRYLILGLSKKDIYDSLRIKEKNDSNKLWDMSFRQFQNYCKKAETIILKRLNKNRDYYLSRGVQRYDLLFSKLYSTENYLGASQVEEKLEKLLRLGFYSKDDSNFDDEDSSNRVINLITKDGIINVTNELNEQS